MSSNPSRAAILAQLLRGSVGSDDMADAFMASIASDSPFPPRRRSSFSDFDSDKREAIGGLRAILGAMFSDLTPALDFTALEANDNPAIGLKDIAHQLEQNIRDGGILSTDALYSGFMCVFYGQMVKVGVITDPSYDPEDFHDAETGKHLVGLVALQNRDKRVRSGVTEAWVMMSPVTGKLTTLDGTR